MELLEKGGSAERHFSALKATSVLSIKVFVVSL